MQPGALTTTDLNLPGFRRGKVRDLYELPPEKPGGAGRILMIATDRLSAFDVVLPTPIPGKGMILTQLSLWWLRFIERQGICRTHLLSTSIDDIPPSAFAGATTAQDLRGRLMIGRRCRVVPVECVVRGYLEGSGWQEYRQTGEVCGVRLPKGLERAQRLPEPIFTPATKEEQGRHDENITFERACELVGKNLMERLRETSLAIYRAAAEHALARGIIIADTKFEFGIPLDDPGAGPIIIDEALTPDSSRFWPLANYAPGKPQESLDKQHVREYLLTLVSQGAWDKSPPGPELPEGIVSETFERYRAAFRMLTNDPI